MLNWKTIAVPAAVMILSCVLLPRSAQGVDNQHGFTGPQVPALSPLLSDYQFNGVQTAEGRTDIPALMSALNDAHVKDYMHLAWTADRTPSAWEDFQLLAPQCQAAGIRLWLYLTPPSEGVPDPFGDNYIRWATECAGVAKQYSCVAGIVIDDFNCASSANQSKFTVSYLRQMMDAAHEIDPKLSLLATCYYDERKTYLANIVKAGAIDGVVFPYYYKTSGNKWFVNTSQLRPQIETFRTWLDAQTAAGGLTDQMPLVTMIYAKKHSQSADSPTSSYVATCLNIGLQATDDGLADGVTTYCLPKNNPAFMEAVADVYIAYNPVPEPGALALLVCGLLVCGLAGVLCKTAGFWRSSLRKDLS